MPSLPPRIVLRRDVQQTSTPISFSVDQWLDRMLARAGMSARGPQTLLLVACVAIAAAMAAFVCELSLAAISLVGVITASLGLCTIYVAVLRRVRKFGRQFPTALELMARATRAGANFESALSIASSSAEEPLKSEFVYCIRQLQMGLTPAHVSADLAQRIGSVDLELLAHTVAVHSRVGGRLATAFERLSSIIRDRSEFLEKMKSATGIARFAIFAILAMSAFVLIYMQFVQPDYLQKLTASPLGRKMIAYSIASEIVGLGWVAFTLRLDH